MIGSRFIKRLKRNTAAVAMTEFALAAPIFLAASLGGLEITHHVLMKMRIEQVAVFVADNIGRIGDTSTLDNRKLYENEINDILMGAHFQAGESTELYKHGRIIVSSLEILDAQTHCGRSECEDDFNGKLGEYDEGTQFIAWQRCLGLKEVESSFGKKHSAQNSGMGPNDAKVYAEPDGATIFVEVIYDYQPLFTDSIVGDTKLHAISSFVVRHNRDRSQVYTRNDYGIPSEAKCGEYSEGFAPAT